MMGRRAVKEIEDFPPKHRSNALIQYLSLFSAAPFFMLYLSISLLSLRAYALIKLDYHVAPLKTLYSEC
jgi:hypothetical protein